jgi:hypothetical protein
MARQLTIRVPATIRGLAKRQRKVKAFWCHVEATVEVPEADRLDNPEAVVLSYERWSKFGRPRKKETVRMVSAGHAGALYRQLKGPTGRAATIEDLIAQDGAWGQNPFFSKFKGRAQASYSELLGSMREIHKDNTAWPVERAKKVAADLILVEGTLWRRDLEPIWTVKLDGKSAETDYQKPFPSSIQAGIPFPLLDRIAAEEAAVAWAARGDGKVKSSGMTLLAADGRFLTRSREGLLRELMTTAFHSARRALNAQYWMMAMSADIASKVDETEAMLMPGGMLSGAAERIDSLLRGVDRDDPYGVPAPRGSWLAAVEAAIALGLEPDLIAGGPSIQFDPNDELLLESLA